MGFEIPVKSVNLNKEAKRVGCLVVASAGGNTVAAGNFYAIADLDIDMGRCYLLRKGLIQVSAACTVLIRTQTDKNGLAITPIVGAGELGDIDKFIYRYFQAAGSYEFDMEDFPQTENVGYQIFIAPEGTTAPKVNINQDYLDITYDLNFDADFVHVLCGDSIEDLGAMGKDLIHNKFFTYQDHWHYKYLEMMAGVKINMRVVNKAYANTTSETGKFQLLNDHYLDGIKFDTLSLGYGMNDAEQGRNVSPSMYRDNLLEWIKYRNWKRKNADIIILSPTPTDSGTRTEFIQDYRDAAFDAADDAQLGGENRGVFFAERGNSFTVTAANFRDTESAGSFVHPNGVGQGKVWDNVTNGGIKSVMQRTKLYLNAV